MSAETCKHCEAKKPFWPNKTAVVVLALGAIVASSYAIPALVPFRITFLGYLGKLWWAMLLGIFLGGAVDYYVPREYISYILARKKKRTIFYAVFTGFLMSSCCHGILALAIELHKKGASNPAVVAFLLASPWANMVMTIMLIGFFGLKAFFIIFSAIFIALTTGLIFQFLERENIVETNHRTIHMAKDFSILDDFRKRLKERRLDMSTVVNDAKGIFAGMLSLVDMVLWWVFIGMGIASFAGAYIPIEIFTRYMGPSLAGLFVTLALATVMEVCSEGSSPMAFEIFRRTGAFGNSFVFLMAGVVTDYTEIGLLWHNVGRRVAIWLPVVSVPQVVLFGYIANIIFK